MRFFKFLPLFFAALCFVSCSKDNSGTEKTGTGNSAYIGTLTVDQNDNTFYIQNNVSVNLTQNGDVAEIKMWQVSFSERMPIKLDMTIPGVCAEEITGGDSLSGDGIIPLAMGGQFPQYIITDMTGTVTGTSLSFTMTCGSYPLRIPVL